MLIDEFDFRSESIVKIRDFEKFARTNEFEKMTYPEWLDLFYAWIVEKD